MGDVFVDDVFVDDLRPLSEPEDKSEGKDGRSEAEEQPANNLYIVDDEIQHLKDRHARI